MKRKLSCLLILVLLFGAGCASLGIKIDSTEKQYLAARAELNLLLEYYVSVQDQISGADHIKAKAAFVGADVALDTWEAGLGKSNYNYASDLAVWLEAKRSVTEILRRISNG